jgi:NAD(P)-dependent dehydrogenase (short-subunit alcohol dehydrogenase family)
MTHLFNGEVALVTGGGSGIGRTTALAFAAQGAKVVVAGRRVSECAETVRLIEAAGGMGYSIPTDVSKSVEVEALIDSVIDRFGSLDFAFNNAGVEGTGFLPLAKYSETTWDEVVDTNLKGVFLCMKYELPHITVAKGAIVNMASVAGLVGGRLGAAYYASKHGVVGLTKAAAMEYAHKGVRINAVAPAVIPSPMTERAFFHDAALTERLAGMHPLGRFGTSDEVANAVLWLCSKGSSFTTGHVLPVDGGFVVP